jgi:Na+/H+ antiporter NhaD/arsenite permease-like protein
MDVIFLIFLLVYVAMGFGHLPGFKVDRTGAAVIGAMALVALGKITPQAAWAAIDYRTVGLLFGLMVVSSAFVVAGFYDKAALWIGGLKVSPPALLAVLIGVAGGLSAILTNDVVVVAMTPVLVSITMARGLNPVPFLLAFCFAANVGSAATLIGSPQNMIAAEALHLSFTGFMRVAALPALLGLPIVWLVIVVLYRGKWTLAGRAAAGPAQAPIPFDRMETLKATIVTLALVAAFIFSDWPHMLVALAGAALLLINRSISSKDMLARVDGNLLLLLMGLFVVNAALATTGLPQQLLGKLRGGGLDLQDPVAMLAVMSILSNIVGNNPAVMLVAPFLDGAACPEVLGAAIALGTGFSSNLVIFGSLAGIIIAEQGKAYGVQIGFGEFSRAGLPVAVLSLLLALAWLLYMET